MTTVIIGLLGIALGCAVLLMGKNALFSQSTFLRLYNKFQQTEQFGIKPFDADYFGGPSKLRMLGAGLIAVGLFTIVSLCAILFDRFR